jgi:hypothetical protein
MYKYFIILTSIYKKKVFMKKNLFEVSQEEKNRILEMHIGATLNMYLGDKNIKDKPIIKEGDEKWRTTYSCVPKFPGAKKFTLKDGSTAYQIAAATYYSNGRKDIGVMQNYSCNDMMFKYPKNQKDGDAFRAWLIKNYGAKDIKRQFDVDSSGPYNSPSLAGAWIVYGDVYSNKKGRENPDKYIPNVTTDPKCGNKPNMEYSESYKRCFLSKTRQKALGDSVNFKDEDFFPVKDDNEWYAYYALYMAQGIETEIAEKWGWDTSKGACKGSSDGSKGLNFPNKGTRNDLPEKSLMSAIKYNETPNQYGIERTIDQMYNICFNESIVFGKPINDLDINNLTATAGKMDKSSFTNYNGYIPSYEEVNRAYGLYGVKDYRGKIWKLENKYFVSTKSNTGGDVRNKKPSTLEGEVAKKLQNFIKGVFDGIDVYDIDVLINMISLCVEQIPILGPEVSFAIDQIHAVSYFIRAWFAEMNNDMPTMWVNLVMGVVQATVGSIPAVGNIQMITITKMAEKMAETLLSKESGSFIVFLYKIFKGTGGSSTPESVGKIIVKGLNEVIEIRDFVVGNDAYFPDIALKALDSIIDLMSTSLNMTDEDWEEIDRQVKDV